MTFAAKCAESIGTLLAGFLLALIAWPTEIAVGEVPADILFNLGLIYGPLVMVIFLTACFVLRGYNISRADHGAAVARLEEG